MDEVTQVTLWLFGAFLVLAGAHALRLGAVESRLRRERSRTLLSRPCAGLAWHQAFRSSPVADIRSFLHSVATLFLLDAKPTHLRPDDRVSTLYAASSPGWMDLMELEEFALFLEREHGVDTRDVWPDDAWPEDLTLGEVFALTQR